MLFRHENTDILVNFETPVIIMKRIDPVRSFMTL